MPATYGFVGVDPGKNGGIVVLSLRKVEEVHKMPETDQDMWSVLVRAEERFTHCYAMLEQVHASPQQGTVSAFTFGMGYGRIRMALSASGIRFEEIRPQVWIKGLRIPMGKSKKQPRVWKNTLKQKAQQLFPSEKITLATSDAFLIAEYCRRFYTGKA